MDRTSEPGAIGARTEPRSGPVHPMHPGGSCAAARSLRSTNRTPVGYGLAAFGDRFTSVPEAGFGMSEGHREYSLGLRFVRDRRGADLGSLELSLEARRGESANDDDAPEHSVGVGLTARW